MSLDNASIVQMLEDYDKETKALKSELFKLCWYMRGGLSYDQALQLGSQEREIIADLIKENLDVTKKTGQPFF